jgi:transglutaminase-like putative cysteine protease
VFYEFNDLARSIGIFGRGERVGVLAQDAQRALPHVVKPAPAHADYLTVQYDKLTPLLVEAVRDLAAALEAERADRQAQVQALEARVRDLEN